MSRRQSNFIGHHFWASAYRISATNIDEETICEYIKRQEEDKKLDQLGWMINNPLQAD